MNIYKCSQTENNSYDTYDSFVCYAKDSIEASNMLPAPKYAAWGEEWASHTDNVTVELIGTATQVDTAKVILASFNAG